MKAICKPVGLSIILHLSGFVLNSYIILTLERISNERVCNTNAAEVDPRPMVCHNELPKFELKRRYPHHGATIQQFVPLSGPHLRATHSDRWVPSELSQNAIDRPPLYTVASHPSISVPKYDRSFLRQEDICKTLEVGEC